MRRIAYALFLLPFFSYSQQAVQPDAAAIKVKLKKLNCLASVLYVAAHPDDENTRIITYLANDRLAASAYLSLTRGDGGQNLIGPEIRDVLGLIRTQELLAARRIDGGEQFFTRANDFGFSKSAGETFRIWQKDDILHDVVKVFRTYQPDVIITRFPPDERAGHGHHTASAILAAEAFDVAAKADVFPELAKALGTWQVKRLYTNTGRWWNNTINENTPGVISLDVGRYNPLTGESFTEVAAISRSQHKSQGFGSAGTRGKQLEFLEYVKGERAQKDIFEGIDTSWKRIKGSDKVQLLVNQAIAEYKEENPAASVPVLLAIRREILALEPGVWKNRKLKETERLIHDCLGLFVTVTADQYWVAPGQKLTASFELVNRSEVEVSVKRIQAVPMQFDTTVALPLQPNSVVQFKRKQNIVASSTYSDPYWLKVPHSIGLFTVPHKDLIGKPENDPAITISFTFSIQGETIEYSYPLFYKWTDPVKGEQERPFEIVPPLFINMPDAVLIFNEGKPREIRVIIKSASESPLAGQLSLQIPKGWKAEPSGIPFTLNRTGEEQVKIFQVTPSVEEMTGVINAVAAVNDKNYDQAVQVVGYDHIPIQTLLPKAQTKVVRLDLKNDGGEIGYIKGAGDDVPAGLRNMGYTVWEMKNEDVTAENLKPLKAVVLGVRALNTNPRIRFIMDELLNYVKEGGTLVLQYNISAGLETDAFSPYPLTLSRDRVTEEDAPVTFLDPGHTVLNYPNKITQKDFEGWEQERGLYFPNAWDNNFKAILSMHDSGEQPKEGALLIAEYGKGYYVYTGLSFFRELPEGVAGAYKLFSNIVSIGNAKKSVNGKVRNKTR